MKISLHAGGQGSPLRERRCRWDVENVKPIFDVNGEYALHSLHHMPEKMVAYSRVTDVRFVSAERFDCVASG